MIDIEALLSRPDSKAGRLQRALLARLAAHQREGTLPTSNRFLFYELVGKLIDGEVLVSKRPTGKRRADQDLIDASLATQFRRRLLCA